MELSKYGVAIRCPTFIRRLQPRLPHYNRTGDLRVMKTGGVSVDALRDSDIIVEAVATAKASDGRYLSRSVDARMTCAPVATARYIHKMRSGARRKRQLIALRDTLVGQSISKGTVMERPCQEWSGRAVGGGDVQPAYAIQICASS